MKKNYTLLIFGTLLLLVFACKKEPDFTYYYYTPEEDELLAQYLNLPALAEDYTVHLPLNLLNAGLRTAPVDRDKAVLGRVLFYDKNLSKDQKISCASCHKQEIAFSDNQRISPGVFGRLGARNAIALGSVANFSAYYGVDINGPGAIRFFWDNRAATAADQNRGSLTNPQEMDMHMEEVVTVIENLPYYQPLFRKAYGTTEVKAEQVNEAIAHFVNAMGSYNSKFDTEAAKNGGNEATAPFTGFTERENHGKSIYMANCGACHSYDMGRPLLYFANNGLDIGHDSDAGVGGISGLAEQFGCFKVPTLRNIALTAPYMHDGRFQTLEEVVEHYNSGVKNNPQLHIRLKSGQEPKRLNLTETDKQDLVLFLRTLTDNHFISDKRFSTPFR
jgi:cytochrome c peroxidase